MKRSFSFGFGKKKDRKDQDETINTSKIEELNKENNDLKRKVDRLSSEIEDLKKIPPLLFSSNKVILLLIIYECLLNVIHY